MLTPKQLHIFEVFAKQPFLWHQRKDIKRLSAEKSNNALALTINKLKEEQVLKEQKIGATGLLTLDLNNEQTINYLALANQNSIPYLAQQIIQQLQKELATITPFYTAAIFGSYAGGQHRKSSDIDVAILLEDEKHRKRIEAAVNTVRLRSVIELDVHTITRDEMVEMLTNNEENLGKEIARKHLTIHNHSIFYDIIKEGIRHGFHLQNIPTASTERTPLIIER